MTTATAIETEPKFLYLTDTLRISRADELNLHLEEFREVKSHKNRYQDEAKVTEKWVFVGYYGTVELAMTGAIQLLNCKAVEEETITTLEEFIANMTGKISEMVQSVSKFGIQRDDFPREKKSRGKAANKDEE